MVWFADNSIRDYLAIPEMQNLRAIGWLERDHEFPRGSIPQEVFDKLVQLLEHPWQPVVSFGYHNCTLCAFVPEARGKKNLFVPGNGFLYVCPELISHYINAHGYAPPDEFCQAVLCCPDMRSMKYNRMLLANGGREMVKWMQKPGGKRT